MVRVVKRFKSIRIARADSLHQHVGVFGHNLLLSPCRLRALDSLTEEPPVWIPGGFPAPAAEKHARMEELVARLGRARSVLVLTGSGISSDSGLPTFRGVGGLWHNHRVEDLASPAGFARNPALVWSWYNEHNAAHRRAKPNAGHYAIARLEAMVGDFTLATQNVDSLHLRAGTTGLLELHGNLREARCDRCGRRRTLDASGLPIDEIEHACGGRMRPDIVWFGESLPQGVWKKAEAAAARAEVILVVGTSALVYPAAALATHYNDSAYVAEINTDETAISGRVDCVLRGTAAETLPRIVEALSR
jgi:NAD-dependent deacetylase